jgi:hypothetical protein
MNGIIQAINLGDNPINISSGGTGNSTMFGDLIAEAEGKGIQIVAATGNSGASEDDYPAAYPGVLSVTASGPNGQLASYANDGDGTKTIAPGTAMFFWDGQEYVVQGTSPAAAEVSGGLVSDENLNHDSLKQAVDLQMQVSPAPKPRPQ